MQNFGRQTKSIMGEMIDEMNPISNCGCEKMKYQMKP